MRVQGYWFGVFLGLSGLGALTLFGQGDQQQQPAGVWQTEFECRWTAGPIVLDGKADEPAWKSAQVIDQFYQPWLGKDARLARTATRAKLLWDREYLYFHADMDDADLYADQKKQDGMLWNNDVFELFFKPAESKPGYYEFQVNPTGAVLDMFLPRRGAGGYERFKDDGGFSVEAKVKLRGTLNNWRDKDDGWSVEGKIPWTDFLRTGGRPERDEKWKFALCRYDYSVDFEGPELSTCAPLRTKVPNFHAFEHYATLTFVGPDKSPSAQKVGLDKRTALTTSKVVGSPEPPPPYRAKRAFPDLHVTWPLSVTPIPNSKQLLVVGLDSSSGSAKVYLLDDDPKASKLETLLSVTDTAYEVTFHPRFAENGYIYLGSSGAPKGSKEKKKTRVTRYTLTKKAPFRIEPDSAKVIIEWDSDGHNGGAVVFGHDGMMYITSGDGTSDSDTNDVGQDMSTLLAKVLRIDVDHPEKGKQYSVPRDNPFVNLKGARPEIWALGLRNPWKMTIDQKTGHIWVGNNGQDLYEQAYLVKKGDNYGWSVMEGSAPFYLQRKSGPLPFVKPTVEHHHLEARSLTGGIVYYGHKFPDLRGAYLYGDYSTGKIWAVKHDGQKILWHKEIADTRLVITGFGVDTRGEILIADYRGKDEGAFFTLEPSPPMKGPSTFPRTLSASGLFRSVKGHVVESALVPYSVNAVLWSDGAAKERWLGVPGDGKIEFTHERGWNFPDQTVIVKSFYLDLEENNPSSRKWIETRFLTRQEGEWYGYSYAWDDEQTEGTLVESTGRDRTYVVKVPKSPEHPDGVRKVNWHYPSRTECLVCHSRAANWVLGLTEVQMNKDHDYGGVVENQLVVFERLGLLKFNDWAKETQKRMRDELKKKDLKPGEINRLLDRYNGGRDQRTAASTTSLLPHGPEKFRKLVDPYDAKADLNLRARSYLHSNCSQCHVEAGGGNALMQLEFSKSLEKMNIVDVKPVHDTYGIKDAKLVVPGHPERSVLLHRITHRDKGHMPPLATRVVDRSAVDMIREWIANMKVPAKPTTEEN